LAGASLIASITLSLYYKISHKLYGYETMMMNIEKYVRVSSLKEAHGILKN